MLAGWHYTVGGSTRWLLGDGQQLLSKETERGAEYVQGAEKKGGNCMPGKQRKFWAGKKRGNGVNDELKTIDKISWLPCVLNRLMLREKGERSGRGSCTIRAECIISSCCFCHVSNSRGRERETHRLEAPCSVSVIFWLKMDRTMET